MRGYWTRPWKNTEVLTFTPAAMPMRNYRPNIYLTHRLPPTTQTNRLEE
jgi:hypothetical protein